MGLSQFSVDGFTTLRAHHERRWVSVIFVVGSVFIVVIGLPSVICFLMAGTAAGCNLAWSLIAWHTKHPQYGLPANRIVWR